MQPNCWRPKRWPWSFPPGYKFGFWTGKQSWRAAGYYPGPRDRMTIAAGAAVAPYFHVMNFSGVVARDAADAQVVPSHEMAIISITGSSDRDGLARFRMYQKTGKDTGFPTSRFSVNFLNCVGSARNPLFLRRAYYPPGDQPIMGRLFNMDTSHTQNVQIVLVGLRRQGAIS
jgi:hypothetical protein